MPTPIGGDWFSASQTSIVHTCTGPRFGQRLALAIGDLIWKLA